MPDLATLSAQLDPDAPLAQRHLWLISLLEWVRGDRRSPDAAIQRLSRFLDLVEQQPELKGRLKRWWQVLGETVDASTLLADFGFTSSAAFVSELGNRLRYKLLPGTPETANAGELFALVLPGAFDARWIALLGDKMVGRIAQLLASQPMDASTGAPGLTLWEREILEAVTYCVSQIRAIGFTPELRTRMSGATSNTQPFHELAADCALDRKSVV